MMIDLAGIDISPAGDPAAPKTGLVGVLGGMGPLATVDFLRKVVLATDAKVDQDHVPLIVSAIPQVPDRTSAFLGHGASPLPAMIESAQRLVRAGAELIVVPCNTAHLWFDELQSAVGLPMIHLVDAAIDEAMAKSGPGAQVGLLATDATMSSGLYIQRHHQRFNANSHQGTAASDGMTWVLPTINEMHHCVMPGIAAVKAGQMELASSHLRLALRGLQNRGASSVILGCTEIPLALENELTAVTLIDATAALARRAVAWSLAARGPRSGSSRPDGHRWESVGPSDPTDSVAQ